jgi:hypothetical protein
MVLASKDDCGYFMQTIANFSRPLSQKLILQENGFLKETRFLKMLQNIRLMLLS